MTPSVSKVQAAKLAIAKAEMTIREERKKREILCSCGELHQIGQLKLLIDHQYVEPYSCSGGDYWREVSWYFVCPVTTIHNRLWFNDYGGTWKSYENRNKIGYAAEPTFKHLYGGLFQSSEDVYGRRGNFVDCDYVDKHREDFELPLPERVNG